MVCGTYYVRNFMLLQPHIYDGECVSYMFSGAYVLEMGTFHSFDNLFVLYLL